MTTVTTSMFSTRIFIVVCETTRLLLEMFRHHNGYCQSQLCPTDSGILPTPPLGQVWNKAVNSNRAHGNGVEAAPSP